MHILLILLVGIVTLFVAAALIQTIRRRRPDEAVVLDGLKLNIVSRGMKLSPAQVKKDGRLKVGFLGAGLVILTGTLVATLITGMTLTLSSIFLLIWLPVYSLLVIKVPMLLLTREAWVVDERRFPFEAIKCIEAEPVSVGHEMRGMFDESWAYVAVTIHPRKKWSKKALFCVHQDDYEQLKDIARSQSRDYPWEETGTWQKTDGANGSLT
ncbi:hypothetical protein [Salisediminibacterium selenitireducens]|uniref:DUF5673 domain-containing protein n=1 Tax=Bacillus selenitireducens (strain ATCC 700615 / DSM 15326 / MLS10) TaxID=439292 RepID=D6XWQ5_BACIE|nr:hypothetical protein [Salisediminibacterium selenitireducens]ADH97897.1 hypothetical protein Bsel_0357 [[Bacillus] selenitireducens MLS10]